MTTPDDTIRERSIVVRNFFQLLSGALWEIERHIADEFGELWEIFDQGVSQPEIEALTARSSASMNKLQDLREAIRTMIFDDPVISYVVFRTVGKREKSIVFDDRSFLTSAHVILEFLNITCHWVFELNSDLSESLDGNASDKLDRIRQNLEQIRNSRVVRNTNIHDLNLEVWREHSWAEEIIQQEPVLPQSPIPVANDVETAIRKTRAALTSEQKPVFDFIVANPNGGHFEELRELDAWRVQNPEDSAIRTRLKEIRKSLPKQHFQLVISDARPEYEWKKHPKNR